jgi:predicted Ser/Thr protein kinase
VRAYVAGEKIQNPRTGQYEDPNIGILEGLEKLMSLRESPDAFRRNLITKIAAYSLEHPKDKIDYHEIFADLFKNLRNSYYKEKAKPLIQLAQYVLVFGTDDASLIPSGDKPKVEKTLKVMREKYNYTDESSKEAISFVLRIVQEKT